MSRLTVVVADAQELRRRSLVALMEARPDFSAVGEARDLDDLRAVLAEQEPDLLVMDVRLPGAEEASAVHQAHAWAPDLGILALLEDHEQRCIAARSCTTIPAIEGPLCCDPVDCIGRVLADGAHAALTRNADTEAFFRTARVVANHQAWLGPDALHSVTACLLQGRDYAGIDRLSQQERKVAAMVREGLCNKEIAVELDISESTVKKHVGQILTKLHLRDRLQVGLFVSRSPFFARDPHSQRIDASETLP